MILLRRYLYLAHARFALPRESQCIYTYYMAQQSNDNIREPVVAGRFYPGDPRQCATEVDEMLGRARAGDVPDGNWIGAVVPHAGWICSGQIAAGAIAALYKSRPQTDLVVVFGAVHTVGALQYGAVDDHLAWRLPAGMSPVQQQIQKVVADGGQLLRLDGLPHLREHSIEVQLPLIQGAWGLVPILPVEVAPTMAAEDIGREVVRLLRGVVGNPVFLASTDLTHYGADYGFEPAGAGAEGFAWAMENDRRLLEQMTAMDAKAVVRETQQHHNACGGGAVAALIGACLELGASTVQILAHTNSYEVLSQKLGRQQADLAVGYASALVR